MRKLRAGLGGIILLFACGVAGSSWAQSDLLGGFSEPYPLRAADTSSPRDTLRTFTRDFNEAIDSWRNDQPQAETLRPLLRAAETIDFSGLPTLGREAETLIDMALLQEVLDRVELPQYEDIPGDVEVASNEDLVRWTIPNTRIEIVRIDEGPRRGEFLFSKETVAGLRSFYSLARELPYKADAMVGIYDEVLSSPGQWLPQRFPDRLPDWSTVIVAGQGIWQWIALTGLIVINIALFIVIIRAGLRWDREHRYRSPWLRMGTPLALAVVVACAEGSYIVAQYGIGLFELPLDLVAYLVLAVQVTGLSWLAFALSARMADAIASLGDRGEGRQRFDAALLRVVFRLVSLVVMMFIAVAAADALGIPIAPLVAGLGVGGLAVALAVRPTLENVIGGLTLFADRPVRVGDFCRYGNDVGTVEQIGLRSTRIRTLEQSVVTVPNSEFSQLHLDNYSLRTSRLLRTVLQLRYETTTDQMRFVLARLRRLLIGHPMVTPEPARVRLVGFGDFSKDVEVFAYLRCSDQDEFLAIREDILLQIEGIIEEAGTGFAFPSSTTYVARDNGVDMEKTSQAEAAVEEWRTGNQLPFPDFPPDFRGEMEDSLPYPPEGSADFRPPGAKGSVEPDHGSDPAASHRWRPGFRHRRSTPSD